MPDFTKPLPRPEHEELTRPFWEAAKRHELVIPRCRISVCSTSLPQCRSNSAAAPFRCNFQSVRNRVWRGSWTSSRRRPTRSPLEATARVRRPTRLRSPPLPRCSRPPLGLLCCVRPSRAGEACAYCNSNERAPPIAPRDGGVSIGGHEERRASNFRRARSVTI